MFSPAIAPPQPAFDANPPSLPVPPVSTLASAPHLHSPATSVPPVVSPAASRHSNSASPVNSPATLLSPVSSPSSPDIIVVPASPPPIMSNDTKDPPPSSSPPSPPSFPLPAQPLPSPVVSAPPPLPFPFPSAPRTINSPLTITFRPPSAPALPNAKSPVPPIASSPPPVNPIAPFFPVPPPSWPIIIPFTNPPPPSSATPSSPTLPAPASASASEPQMPSSKNSSVTPEGQLPAAPPAGVLPLAVGVQKPPIFHMSAGLIIGLAIGGAILLGLVLAIVSFFCACHRHRRKRKHDLLETSRNAGSKGSHVIQVEENPVVPPYLSKGGSASVPIKSKPENPIPTQSIGFNSLNGIFTNEELLVATNGFSESNLLGQGGFGYVYKGVLPSGKEIAVKKLKTGSHQGEREFQAEIETISRVHHKHLVELVGYCVTGTDRSLVYEFVPNNTLESHLHGEGRPVIEWATRLKIALGSARGLAYLHEDCNPAIIHRDIKASNILLDYKFEAKVSDFGLAKIFPNADSCTHVTTRVVGTFGYLAPEYASSGKLTDKSDVYSFGVILLELITGRPPITATDSSRNQSLVEWARPSLAQALKDGEFSNLVDPRLEKNYRDDEMARMITCAAACVRHSARLRPRMTQMVGALEGLVSLADIVEDIRPEYTKLYSWSGSSNYDAYKYQEDIRNFNLALSSHKYSFCGNSENTSTYGVHISDSSSEDQQTNQNT